MHTQYSLTLRLFPDAYAPASVSQTPTPSPAPASSSSSNVGAIAGGVVGGVVGLAILGAIIFFLLRKQKRTKQAKDGDMGAGAMVPMMNEKHGERLSAQYGGQSRRSTLYLVLRNANVWKQRRLHTPLQTLTKVSTKTWARPKDTIRIINMPT